MNSHSPLYQIIIPFLHIFVKPCAANRFILRYMQFLERERERNCCLFYDCRFNIYGIVQCNENMNSDYILYLLSTNVGETLRDVDWSK